MPSVAQLRTANSAAASEEDVFIEDLRGLVWSDERTRNRTWDQLAQDADLCYSTIRNFASGQTKKPHHITIHKLLRAMDLRFAIVPRSIGRISQEVRLEGYRKQG